MSQDLPHLSDSCQETDNLGTTYVPRLVHGYRRTSVIPTLTTCSMWSIEPMKDTGKLASQQTRLLGIKKRSLTGKLSRASASNQFYLLARYAHCLCISYPDSTSGLSWKQVKKRKAMCPKELLVALVNDIHPQDSKDRGYSTRIPQLGITLPHSTPSTFR